MIGKDFKMMHRSILLILTSLVFPCIIFAKPTYTLEYLCENGVTTNPAIKALNYKIKAKEYGYAKSIDTYKPHINFNTNIGYKETTTNIASAYSRGVLEYSVNAVQPIYVPSFLNSIKNAKLNFLLSKLKLKNEKALLIAKISNLSIELIRQNQLKMIAKKNKELYKRVFDITNEKYKLRLVDKTSLFQSKAQLEDASSNLVSIEQQYLFTLNSLRLLVNDSNISSQYFHKVFKVDALQLKKEFTPLLHKQFYNRVASNTQLKLYKVFVKIAKNNINKNKVKYYPTAQLDLEYGSTKLNSVEGRSNVAQALLNINIPIYQGGETSDAIQQAKLNYNAVEENYNSINLKNHIAFTQNWTQIFSSINNIAAASYSEKANYFYVTTALESFKDEIKDLTYVQLAEVNYYNAKIKYINTQAKMLKSLINLYYYTGLSTSKNIKDIETKYITITRSSNEF